VSIFKHPGVYENRVTFYGVLASLTIMIICTYIPWLQEHVFKVANPPGLPGWVPHFFFGAYCLIFTEITKSYARSRPNSWFARKLMW
jgi:hypothetical protein